MSDSQAADPTLARRAAILDATIRSVAALGAERVRMQDVAREAGVSVGLLQHYFGSRDVLLLEGFRRALDLAAAEWLEIAAEHADPWDRLQAFARFAVSGSVPFAAAWSTWLEFWARSLRDPLLRDEGGELYERWVGLVRQTLADGAASGRFRLAAPLDEAADSLVAVIDGLAVRTLLHHPRMSEERMERLVLAEAARLVGLD